MRHCSNITINMVGNNRKDKNNHDDNLFFIGSTIDSKKPITNMTFETVDDVLSQYESDPRKSISSIRLGQEMFRIGIGPAKRKTFPNDNQPYDCVGIRYKNKTINRFCWKMPLYKKGCHFYRDDKNNGRNNSLLLKYDSSCLFLMFCLLYKLLC